MNPATPIVRFVLKADLDVDLLRDRQSVLDLDAEVPDGAFQLGMPEQELDCTDVARTAVDQRCLGTAQ